MISFIHIERTTNLTLIRCQSIQRVFQQVHHSMHALTRNFQKDSLLYHHILRVQFQRKEICSFRNSQKVQLWFVDRIIRIYSTRTNLITKKLTLGNKMIWKCWTPLLSTRSRPSWARQIREALKNQTRGAKVLTGRVSYQAFPGGKTNKLVERSLSTDLDLKWTWR